MLAIIAVVLVPCWSWQVHPKRHPPRNADGSFKNKLKTRKSATTRMSSSNSTKTVGDVNVVMEGETETSLIVLESRLFNDPASLERDWLVLFYDEHCSTCEDLFAHFYSIADKLRGTVNVAEANVHDVLDIAGQYDISRIPTVLLLHRVGDESAPMGVALKPYYHRGSRKIEHLIGFALHGFECGGYDQPFAHHPNSECWL
jgi:thiol-disulfide isomerase/thioredoxin